MRRYTYFSQPKLQMNWVNSCQFFNEKEYRIIEKDKKQNLYNENHQNIVYQKKKRTSVINKKIDNKIIQMGITEKFCKHNIFFEIKMGFTYRL